jgi:hypothetical protein
LPAALVRQAMAASPEVKAAPPIRHVNSKRVSLNYEVGSEGGEIAGVELWCTRDGRTWSKRESQQGAKSACVVDVDDEDLYGLTLVVCRPSGPGAPPQEGDAPQVWMEIDVTKPVVRLLGVDYEKTATGRNLTIRWRAADKNLSNRAVNLSYAAELDGSWTTFAKGVENAGTYTWSVPADAPARMHIRIEATDLAGNTGIVQTDHPVGDERIAPTVAIRAVEAID